MTGVKVTIQAHMDLSQLIALFKLYPVETVIVQVCINMPEGIKVECDSLESASEFILLVAADELKNGAELRLMNEARQRFQALDMASIAAEPI